MYFCLTWDDNEPKGYVVNVVQRGLLGDDYKSFFHLFKFAEQGDAICAKLYDMPKLEENKIIFAAKMYTGKRLLHRRKQNSYIPVLK